MKSGRGLCAASAVQRRSDHKRARSVSAGGNALIDIKGGQPALQLAEDLEVRIDALQLAVLVLGLVGLDAPKGRIVASVITCWSRELAGAHSARMAYAAEKDMPFTDECEVGTVAVIAAGCRVLVVEDEYLIAHEIAYALALLGVIPVGPVATFRRQSNFSRDSSASTGPYWILICKGKWSSPWRTRSKRVACL
jgi:hypothetical protein